jgi:hypothetical protein
MRLLDASVPQPKQHGSTSGSALSSPAANPGPDWKGAEPVIHRRAIILLIAALGVLPASTRAATVWTALASEKIRLDAPARSASAEVAVAAAKNEFEAFQIVVTGPAKGVSASASDLKGPVGTIGGVKLFREAYLNITDASANDGALGMIPDALVPDVDEVVGEKRNAFPFDVAAGESRAIWVEVHVPQSANAGVYQGAVTLHSADGDQQVPVKLTVWDFALPSTPSLKSAFTLGGGVKNGHGLDGDAYSQLRTRYGQLALDHRISLDSVWADGNKDFAHIDQFYGSLFDGSAGTQLQGAKLTTIVSGANLSSAAEHKDWADHFKAKGWFDRLFQYTCDEPPITCQWSDIPARAALAKQADPNFRTLVTTDAKEATQNGGQKVLDAIDLITPLVNYLDDRGPSNYGWQAGGESRTDYDKFLASSPQKELWLYQSCMSHGCGGTVDIGNPSADMMYFTGWPSYMVDASSVRSRAMEWLSFRYDATGELYYETVQAYYDRNAWQSIWEFTGNGDGTLFYPGTPSQIGGTTDIPVASIRMKMIREGMEDYEYLKILADLGDKETAKQIAAKLFPHAYETDAKPEDLMGAREAIARKILALTAKAAPPAGASGVSSGTVAKFDYLVTGAGCGTSSSARTGAGLVSVLLAPLALAWRGLRRRRRTA